MYIGTHKSRDILSETFASIRFSEGDSLEKDCPEQLAAFFSLERGAGQCSIMQDVRYKESVKFV